MFCLQLWACAFWIKSSGCASDDISFCPVCGKSLVADPFGDHEVQVATAIEFTNTMLSETCSSCGSCFKHLFQNLSICKGMPSCGLAVFLFIQPGLTGSFTCTTYLYYFLCFFLLCSLFVLLVCSCIGLESTTC